MDAKSNPSSKTNPLALTSSILGILSVLTCGVGFIFSIPGLVCGVIGMKRVKRSGGAEKGHRLAVAGIVMCAVSFVMLAAIGSIKAPEPPAAQTCARNLKSIHGAKGVWALEKKKEDAHTPTDADLFGPDSYIREKPKCPKGGIYEINPVNSKPTCTVPGHDF